MRRCFLAAALGVALIIAGCSKSSDSGSGGLLSKAESALTPSDPWTEFALMSSARAKATSWRSKMVMNQAGQAVEMDSEVMCPDKQHSKMVTGGNVTMESYMIGKTMYVNMGGRMMKTTSPMSSPAECAHGSSTTAPATTSKLSFGSLPNVKDLANGLENLEKLKQNVTITKGGVSTVEGDSCQEWNVVYNDPQTKQGYKSNYCVGVLDHLPRRMTMDSGMGKMEMTYWDWNKNIDINPPTT